MSIQKNEIPILEFDTDENAVIMPDHGHIDVRLPPKAVLAFLGDEIDAYAAGHGGKIAGGWVQQGAERHILPVLLVHKTFRSYSKNVKHFSWECGILTSSGNNDTDSSSLFSKRRPPTRQPPGWGEDK